MINNEDILCVNKKGFIPLRTDKAAHEQIRPIAEFIKNYFEQII